MGFPYLSPYVGVLFEGARRSRPPSLEGVNHPGTIRVEDHSYMVGSVAKILEESVGLGSRSRLDGARKGANQARPKGVDALPLIDLRHTIAASGGSLIERGDTRSITEGAPRESVHQIAFTRTR